MKKDPLYVALWRFDQISSFLDKRLIPGERARMIEKSFRQGSFVFNIGKRALRYFVGKSRSLRTLIKFIWR